MINFIIGEDHKLVHKKIEKIINQVMMHSDLEYKIYHYYDYDDKFLEMIDNKIGNKIYLLDIVTPSSSGIDMARKIREIDIDSIIIFLTGHKNEYKDTILESEFMFFACISKKDENYEDILFQKLSAAIKIVFKKKAIHFWDHNVLYTIPLKDILYITTDTLERKTLIITDYADFHISKTLYEIEEMLDNTFLKTHRSCLVNKDRIVYIDMKEGMIYFDNKTSIYLLSRGFKKQLKRTMESESYT